MAIESRTRMVYFAACDKCSAAGPDGLDKEDARINAEDDGWHILTEWNGSTNIETITCPRCRKD